ncbi:MAG: TolB family protein [Gaiellaceae bacterium]
MLIRAALVASVLAALAFAPTAGATFPGKNGLIAFNAITADGTNQIFTVRSNGNRLTQITRGDGDALSADWSPDGRKIVFELDTADGASIELMNADGSDVQNLTPVPTCCQGQPSFTPDGQRIVFERFDLDTFDDGIWSMNVDGTDQRHVISPWPNGTGFATDPNVSPDGKTLSFIGFDGTLVGPAPAFEPAQGLYTSTLDGSALAQLLPVTDDLAIKHDWSPDGRRLVVGVNANFLRQGDSANIGTLSPDGTDFRPLTNFHDGVVNAFAGSYSPDGRSIVFRLEDHRAFSLVTMRADGSHLKTILPPSATFRPRNIDWGPKIDADGEDGD